MIAGFTVRCEEKTIRFISRAWSVREKVVLKVGIRSAVRRVRRSVHERLKREITKPLKRDFINYKVLHVSSLINSNRQISFLTYIFVSNIFSCYQSTMFLMYVSYYLPEYACLVFSHFYNFLLSFLYKSVSKLK